MHQVKHAGSPLKKNRNRSTIHKTLRRYRSTSSTFSNKRFCNKSTTFQHGRNASGTSKPSKKAITTGNYYEVDNNSLPENTAPDTFIPFLDVAPQWKNTYPSKQFKVSALYTNEQQRMEASKRAINSDNQILRTLRKNIKDNAEKGMPFYLVDMPRTPDPSPSDNRLYVGDPASFAFPPNKFLSGDQPSANWGNICVIKTDMLDLWDKQNSEPLPDADKSKDQSTSMPLPSTTSSMDNVSVVSRLVKALFKTPQYGRDSLLAVGKEDDDGKMIYRLDTPNRFRARAQFEANGIDSAKRLSDVILNRVKNPAIYERFGLDGGVWHTRLAMYAVHVWLYMRAQQYRPIYCSADARDSLLKLLDADTQESLRHDWQFLKAKDRHNMTALLLPWYRSMMINGDKALNALAGGDPQPFYSFLYRMFYRNNEIQRHSRKYPFNKEALRGWHYAADIEVYMENPPDLAYLNHFANYIVNIAYDMHTKTPRDYNAMLMGFISMVPIPPPLVQKDLLGPITPEEMERWCFPVFRAAATPVVPGPIQRAKNLVFPEKFPTENWFLNPKTSGPAWRPPQYAQTASGLQP